MKSVIITGAGGNLGRAVTNQLAKEYYLHVALGPGENDHFFAEHPDRKNIECNLVNLTDEINSESYIQKIVNKNEAIDAAILLVGGWQQGVIEDTTLADIDNMIKLNFATAFNIVRPLMNYFKKRNSGRFVFIGARPAIRPADAEGQFAYALSKSMVIKMAEFINQSRNANKIQAHVIIPSVLDTPQNRMAMPDSNPADWVNATHIAQTIQFLLTDAGNNFRETILKIYNKA